jgi:hypothetical protein
MKSEYIQQIKNTIDTATKYGEKTRIRLQGNILFALFDLYKGDAQIKAKVASLFEKEESVYADVVSSQENPNCSCRGRFTGFINNNFDKCFGYFEELFASDLVDDEKALAMATKSKEMWDTFLIAEKTRIQNELSAVSVDGLQVENSDTLSEALPATDAGGKIFTIENSESNYMNFVKNLNSLSYRGISVVEQGNKLKIYVY